MLICWYKHVEPVNKTMIHTQNQKQFHNLQWINKSVNYFMILNVELGAIAGGFFFSIFNDDRVISWSLIAKCRCKRKTKLQTTQHMARKELPTDRTFHVIIDPLSSLKRIC